MIAANRAVHAPTKQGPSGENSGTFVPLAQSVTVDDPLGQLAAWPGVAQTVAEARAAVDGLLNHRMLRQRSAEVSAESSLRGARASAELDGAAVELEWLRVQLMAGGPLTLPEPGRAVVEGTVRLHAELGTMLAVWERAPRQALARMHVLAASGFLDSTELGRPRHDAVAEDPLGLGAAPDAATVPPRLNALADLVVTPTAAPALVTYALVHGELLTLRPFPAGNGLVARAAGRLVLIARGLDPKSVSVPEVGHRELHTEYAAAARDYAAGTADGLARWVRHCGRAVALGAREGLAVCEALVRG